jgi:hypothetical protein
MSKTEAGFRVAITPQAIGIDHVHDFGSTSSDIIMIVAAGL